MLNMLMVSVLHNMTKLRRPDLTSYVVVSELQGPLPKRDRTKFTRGDSISRYPNGDTHGDGIGLNPEGLQTGCWEGTSAKATAQATSRGRKGHCISGHPPIDAVLRRDNCPICCFPSLHPEESSIMPLCGKLLQIPHGHVPAVSYSTISCCCWLPDAMRAQQHLLVGSPLDQSRHYSNTPLALFSSYLGS